MSLILPVYCNWMCCAHQAALAAVEGAAKSRRAGVSAASGASGRSGSGSDAKLLPAAAAFAAAALPPDARSPCAGADVVVVKGSRSCRSKMLICGHICGSGVAVAWKHGWPPAPAPQGPPAAWSPCARAPASQAF